MDPVSRTLLSVGGTAAATPTYIEDVFSTYLYTGNSSTQTITNGIDLSGKGGLTWIKNRASGYDHCLVDTARGTGSTIYTNYNYGANVGDQPITAFTSSGFSLNASGGGNGSGSNYVSWTFRKQAKFFDVVTYTGDGTASKAVTHALGSVPGVIIVKCTSNSPENWQVYHRSYGAGYRFYLNTTMAADSVAAAAGTWANTTPTDTQFFVGDVDDGGGTNPTTNATGRSYVAYLFAHDAGGFGLTGADNVISCGSYTTDAAGSASISLGYEPQWVLIKKATGAADAWWLFDSMRGMPSGAAGKYLNPSASSAEGSGTLVSPTSTGFNHVTYQASSTFIYIAIRRGPMKTPTSGVSVFASATRTGTSSSETLTSAGFPPDLFISRERTQSSYLGAQWYDRLRGPLRSVYSIAGDAEQNVANTVEGFDTMAGVKLGFDGSNWGVNNAGVPYANFNFRRAPGFFDVVCYTGTGTARTVNHNLGVVPELMIVKNRSAAYLWLTYWQPLGAAYYVRLDGTNTPGNNTFVWNNTAPTSSVFSVGDATNNAAGNSIVAYLFASCPGVSKVGTYTGNGSSQTINCGFTAGARFVMVRRTDSTGDWYVWDTARGIIAANDPHLSLNTTAAEVTTNDSIDPDNSGFIVNQVADTNINVSSATYIYLAIA